MLTLTFKVYYPVWQKALTDHHGDHIWRSDTCEDMAACVQNYLQTGDRNSHYIP